MFGCLDEIEHYELYELVRKIPTQDSDISIKKRCILPLLIALSS